MVRPRVTETRGSPLTCDTRLWGKTQAHPYTKESQRRPDLWGKAQHTPTQGRPKKTQASSKKNAAAARHTSHAGTPHTCDTRLWGKTQANKETPKKTQDSSKEHGAAARRM